MRIALASLLAALAVVPSAAAQAPSPSTLRIVVIEGEDAVNIIQQKTAVAPVVEVRDQNNLPIPGVAVTFSITGQGATFSGASTLTVVTNAAGQATAAGLTPTAAGALQIQATAALQGQTAVATIVQSNVMTAAEAAAAAGGAGGTGAGGGSGGASAGGAAGGGGALSGTTLGIIGAAAAGGVAAASAAGGGGDSSSTASSRPAGTSSTSPTTTSTPAPAPSSSATFSGPMSGQLVAVSSTTSDGFTYTCNVTYSLSGTVKTAMQRQAGSVSGTGNADGTQTYTSSNCEITPPPIAAGPFAYSGALSGTEGSFRFSQEYRDSGTAADATYTITGTATFTGSVSGNTVTGTFSINSVVDYRGTGFTGRATATGTFPVTLR